MPAFRNNVFKTRGITDRTNQCATIRQIWPLLISRKGTATWKRFLFLYMTKRNNISDLGQGRENGLPVWRTCKMSVTWERERERQRQTETDRDRQRDWDRQRETQRDRLTETERDINKNKTDRQTDRQTETGRDKDRQTDREAQSMCSVVQSLCPTLERGERTPSSNIRWDECENLDAREEYSLARCRLPS